MVLGRRLPAVLLVLAAGCGKPTPSLQLGDGEWSAELLIGGSRDVEWGDTPEDVRVTAYLSVRSASDLESCGLVEASVGPVGAVQPMASICTTQPGDPLYDDLIQARIALGGTVYGAVLQGYQDVWELRLRDPTNGAAIIDRATVIAPTWYAMSLTPDPATGSRRGARMITWAPADQPYTTVEVGVLDQTDTWPDHYVQNDPDDGWAPVPKQFADSDQLLFEVLRRTRPPAQRGLQTNAWLSQALQR